MFTLDLKRNLLLCAAFFIFPAFIYAQDTSVVKTTNGAIAGLGKNGVAVFKGIPFAAPPVGNLRWKAPQPAAHWTSVRQCYNFAASAVQTKPRPFMMYTEEFLAPPEPLSEDCLYLNVWAPAGKSASAGKLPVIVFIHGGGFVSGAGSCPIYDGSGMAQKGVVFVTINYRLGIFGFFAHPGLSKESGHHGSGNYGLLDQIAALKWVNKNIAAFGGDADNVTIMGQSAGAFSVHALVASPLAKGLFARAIAQSGGMFSDVLTRTLPQAEKAGLAVQESLNAGSLAGLRQKSAEEILNAAKGYSFGPVVDGYLLPADVYTIFKQGKQNDVPLLTGWNTGDGFLQGKALNAVDYKKKVLEKFGSLAAQFLKVYPGTTDEEAKTSQMAFARNQFAEWQAHAWAMFQNRKGVHRSYLYWFSHIPPYNDAAQNFGAFHSSEITYTLNNLDTWHRPWKQDDRELADLMSSYWINFATNGDPNGSGLTLWPAYDVQTGTIMTFEEKPVPKPELLKDHMELGDEIYNRQHH
jgi:para-nitrobenzyl esterase